ncbi:copper chaperone PCu(A)C [Catenulispora pinisilvae]|uniref:copper chaperone PCu(A)C n=1 Tax=Catenulispora pinisilvae TaxID=2705253 RepID=UPI0018922AE0|nr:copper chaperone PCu(A)C [Catenulispora pinisilvae]
MNLPLKVGALAAPVAVLAAGAALLVWSGGSASAGAAQLKINDAYVREPANPDEAAAYFTIANDGGTADTLTKVASSTGQASLHETVGPKMVALASASVPAHGTLDFSPGGSHLMIDDPGPLTPGTKVRLTFTFAASAPITVTVPVIGIADPAPGQSSGQ